MADDLERLGVDQYQIALGDRCRLRAPDIDADGWQHGAAVAEFRHSVGRLPNDTDSDASADAASLPRGVFADIGVGEECIDGRRESVDHGSFARKEALSRTRPVVLPSPPATPHLGPPDSFTQTRHTRSSAAIQAAHGMYAQ